MAYNRSSGGALLVAVALGCLVALAHGAVRQKRSYNPRAPNAPPFPPPATYVTLPVYTTFTLPDSLCTSIITQPDTAGVYFRFSVSNDTASAWNHLYPVVPIVAGNVNTQIYAFRCASLLAGKRRLAAPAPAPSTVTTHSFCYLPDGVTRAQAAIASASFIEATTAAFIRGAVRTQYNVSKVQVTTHPSFSIVFCTGTVSTNTTSCVGGTNATISSWATPALPTTGRK